MKNLVDVVDKLTKAVENHKVTEVEEIYGYLSKEEMPDVERESIDSYIKAAYKYWTQRN